MNIEITGCRNCWFSYIKTIHYKEVYRCSLNERLNKKELDTQDYNCDEDEFDYFYNITPENCPIPKEGITIKPKQ